MQQERLPGMCRNYSQECAETNNSVQNQITLVDMNGSEDQTTHSDISEHGLGRQGIKTQLAY